MSRTGRSGGGGGARDEFAATIASLIANRRFEDAYLHIVDTLGPGIHGYLRAMTRSDVHGEDLYQALRVTLWEQLPTLGARIEEWEASVGASSSVRAWLYRIARNRAIDWLRRHSRDNVPLPSNADLVYKAPGASSAARGRERKELVDRLLGALTPGERDVYILRAERDLSFKEIGEILGVADTAAKERFQRAKARLKRLLSPTETR
jgi:RNA polymerase sigma-70 factor (ECF subfamily)